MTVIQLHPGALQIDTGLPPSTAPASDALLRLLLGATAQGAELPPLRELLIAVIAMAEGTRRKSLLPLAAHPAEWSMLRRGANVLVSYYHTESSPEVVLIDRRVPLRTLLAAAGKALLEDAKHDDLWSRELVDRLVQRASALKIAEDADTGVSATRRLGGALEDPGEKQPIAFGFEAAIFPSPEAPRDAVAHADVHAMLFGGQLWGWVRGR